MKKNVFYYLLHLCLCIAFLLLPYVFTATGSTPRLPDLVGNGHDRTYFGVYFSLLLFFYLNFYVLIPRLYYSQKRILYFAIIFGFLLFFLFMSDFFDRPEMNIFFKEHRMPPHGMPPPHHHGPPHFGPPPHLKPNQNSHTILIFLIGVLASLFLSINRRLQASEKDKMIAQLSLLKAQINPHFLFNTLNSIYALAIRKDDRTADSIVQLSELMRYIMSNANNDEIGLDKEINYINNYIALQKSRLGNTARIEYEVDGNAIGKQITPLILISFIENAFKHGVNPDENSEIVIRISIDGNGLTLFVSNKKVQSVHNESGIGMQNTIERLEFLYAGKHSVHINETDEIYEVTLKMEL